MSILSAQRKITPSFPPTIRLAAWLSTVMLSLVLATAPEFFAQTSSEPNHQTPLSGARIVNAIDDLRQTSDEVDIPALVRESDFNGPRSHERLLDYTYTLK